MKAAIVLFPGTNRDTDMKDALARAGAATETVWHGDTGVPDCDLIVLPGGFSHGDYLRCGAMAAHSPVMKDIVAKARAGTPTLGVCNGFQTLIETGLLPGALLRNASLRFVCRDVHLRLENRHRPLTGRLAEGDVIRVPVAHGDGNYFAADEMLKRLEGDGRIAFRYVAGPGEPDERANPNGSTADIAGIVNRAGNVLGMMPHPEDATGPRQQSLDAVPLFHGIVEALS
ncbi:MAG: phosphoribosylformylglycinamidine synthase I [Rhodospirillales bacterium]|nr:phosphoribosylformylglycinamidine synthase I [Rhodospirillales bacterium]